MLDASLCTAANSPQKKKTEKGPLLRFFLRGGDSCTQAIGWLKTRSPKTTAKLIQNNVYCVFHVKQYFGWPYQPSSGLPMLLNLCRNHNII